MEKMNRYPGSQPFTKKYQSLFFGRTQDIKELYRHINAHKISVLYGKSGLGKSSMLNAGVVPLLEKKDNYLPYFIRFNNCIEADTKNYVSPLQIFTNHIFQNGTTTNLLDIIQDSSISIWQQFKSLQLQHTNKDGILLVFDQFEELFTYPEEDVDAFGKELAELLNNRMPQNFKRTLYRKYKEDNEIFNDQDFDLQDLETPIEIRVVCSIRADRMSWMQKITNHIPNILRNCFELKPLNKEQATEAIVLPAELSDDIFQSPPFEYKKEAVNLILDYLSTGDSENIEPFQLQLICQFIEEEIVIRKKQTVISPQDLGNLKEITHNYYQNILTRFPASKQLDVRRFIEDGLIFEEENRRVALLEGQIIRQFKMTKEDLTLLVNYHLLRAEINTSNLPVYELSHDALIAPILDFKRERKADENKLALIETQEKEKKRFLALQASRRKKTLNKLIIGGISLGLLAFLGLNAFLVSKNNEIERLLEKEHGLNQELAMLKKQAEQSRDTAMLQKTLADSNAMLASISANLATLNAKQAIIQRKLAEKNALLADSNALLARSNQAQAELNAADANAERIKVIEARMKVEEALKEVQKLKDVNDADRQIAEKKALELTSQRKIAEKRLEDLTKSKYTSSETLEKAKDDLANNKKMEEEAWNNAKRIKANFLITEAERIKLENPVQAIRLAESAYKLSPQALTLKYIQDLYGANPASFAEFSVRMHKGINTIKPVIGSNLFLIATEDGLIQLRDMKGNIVKELKNRGENFTYTEYNNINSLFAILDNKILHLYKENGKELVKAKRKSVSKVRFSPDGSRLAYTDTKGDCYLMDVTGKKSIKLKRTGKEAFTFISYANQGIRLFTASGKRLIQSWSPSGELLSSFQFNEDIDRLKPSADGNFMIVVTQKNNIQVLTAKGELYATFENNSDVFSIDFSPEDAFIIVGCQDGGMRIWETPTANAKAVPPLIRYQYPQGANSARFAPNFSESKKVCVSSNQYLYIQFIRQEDILAWLSKSNLPQLDESMKKKYDLF